MSKRVVLLGQPVTHSLSEALQEAFARNPDMRVFVASGYYDLATPYFATEYTLELLSSGRLIYSTLTTTSPSSRPVSYTSSTLPPGGRYSTLSPIACNPPENQRLSDACLGSIRIYALTSFLCRRLQEYRD